MNNEELKKILENHMHWIKKDCEGWESMRVNLCGADLYGADLRGADLCGANLYEANLREANLRGANLYGADLCRSDLRGADLRGADLRVVNLCRADLYEANLRGAELYGADLYEAQNMPSIPYICPDFGAFIGWKKANKHIVCLEIPEDAKRLSGTARKCRCNKAKVLSISNMDGSESELVEIRSDYDREFIYRVGEMVQVEDFDDDRWNECSKRIHFFINRQEAVEY